jgi:uncharacterized Ntn-hydrolase superfamily protein
VALGCSGAADPRTEPPRPDAPSTFSIVAWDAASGDLGVAVASKFLAVGSVVPWVEEGVGAVATQSYANTSYGPRGLALLREGIHPDEAIRRLTDTDPERDSRQVGMVDSKGRAGSWTGKSCLRWAGSKVGDGFAVQGNILVGRRTLEAMATAYSEARGELAERLLQALEAGEEAGGDARGRQSAAILVCRKSGGYGGFNGRYIDLRVDDHTSPVGELRRLLLITLGRDPASEARRLEREGRRDEALGAIEDGLRRWPGWAALRFECAGILFRKGETTRAIAELDRAVAADPLEPSHHLRAARILAEADRIDEALDRIRQALSVNPDYAEVIRRDLESGASPFHRLGERIRGLLEPGTPKASAP